MGKRHGSAEEGKKMAWYTVTAKVERGTGDYGSDYKTILDEITDWNTAVAYARVFKSNNKCDAMVFRGKSVGKLIFTTLNK